MRNARLGEALFGAFLLSAGLFALFKASAFPLGSLSQPESGLFPVAVAVALTVFAVLSLRTLRHSAGAPGAERAGIVRVVVLIAALAAYAWVLPRAGFVICTLALLVLLLRGLGRVGWTGTTAGALVGTLCCYVLFTRLGLPLPSGWFGF